MQSGRRFFITGWRSADALAAFEERLARAANGLLTPVTTQGGKRWLFVPQDDGDVLLARGLCAEYDVALCLRVHGGGHIDAMADATEAPRASLVVDPSRLQALKRYGEGAQAVWRAQAGCTLGALADAGLTQFAGGAAQMTLAQWACGRHDDVRSGETAATGVVGADVLFSDGTVETLGGFGANDTRALKSARVQAMVPALFELARSDIACQLRAQPRWLAQARLDALVPASAQGSDDINVARVFLGHQGRYGWILQWLLRVPVRQAHDPSPSTGFTEALPATPTTNAARYTGLTERAASTGSTEPAFAALVARVPSFNDAVGQVLDPENRYGGATTIA